MITLSGILSLDFSLLWAETKLFVETGFLLVSKPRKGMT